MRRALIEPPGTRLISLLALLSTLATDGLAQSSTKNGFWWFPDDPREVAPYKATPMNVVERMLELAEVQLDDVVYDLGSGDGRILIAAAKKYGVRGVGFEINQHLVRKSREDIRRAGVEDLVEIREEDIMRVDVSGASIVTLYLHPEVNASLRSTFQRQLKPGARVVSTDFPIGEWEPDHVEELRSLEGQHYTLFLWKVLGPEDAG